MTATLPTPLTVSAQTGAQQPSAHARRWRYGLALLLVTLAGGALRFTHLDQPSLWGDECATFSRVCGEYRDMLDILQKDGFGPLHYELYWVLWHTITLTPRAMRFVPALAGTLMIPAMYFLARQMAGRATALLTAMFTAASAYLLVYSRDAKMYMHFWLFGALAAACLLCWLRTGRRLAWLGWIASGLAALGLHSSGGLVLAVYPLMLLAQRRLHWRTAILFLVGLVVIGAGPAGYYLGFNRWTQVSGGGILPGQADPTGMTGHWAAGGISWVDDQTRGKPAWELVRHSATAYLFGYSRAEEHPDGGGILIPPRILKAVELVLWTFVGLFALAALPWRRRWQGISPDAPEPWWRSMLWLSAWLVLPVYGFYYCRSVDGFVSPSAWIDWAGAWVNHRWWLAALIAVAVMAIAARWPTAGGIAALLMAAGLAGSLTWAVLRVRAQWWDAWIGLVLGPRFGLWTLAVGAGLIWHFSAPRLGERIKRLGQFALVVALLLGVCWGAFATWDYLYRETLRRTGSVNWQSMWMPRYVAIVWPAMAIAVAGLLLRLPTRPLRWTAITFVLAVNLLQGTARWWAGNEPPLDRVVDDVLAAQPMDATVRTYAQTSYGRGSPGTGNLFDYVGSYYFAVRSGQPVTQKEFRSSEVPRRFRFWENGGPWAIAQEVKLEPRLTRLIVWEVIPAGTPAAADEPLLTALGGEWKKASDQLYPVRVYWNWQSLNSYRRRIYVKEPAPATAPATQPAHG